MLQVVETNILCFQIKNGIRDAQIPQPWAKSMNSMRLDLKCTLCQVAHHTSFLSTQSNVIASFSFGVCTEQTVFQLLHIFVDICENTVNFHIFGIPTDSSECIDHYGFTWTEELWMWPFNGRF